MFTANDLQLLKDTLTSDLDNTTNLKELDEVMLQLGDIHEPTIKIELCYHLTDYIFEHIESKWKIPKDNTDVYYIENGKVALTEGFAKHIEKMINGIEVMFDTIVSTPYYAN